MKLHELSPAEGSATERFRKGRGAGSGNGKTAGKGHKGQNARLAARLTGYKIDIKSETQAREAGDILDYDEYDEYDDDEEYYDEDGEYYDENEEYYDENEEYYDDAEGEGGNDEDK